MERKHASLAGGQVVHELSKHGLAGIHPSLSVSGAGSAAAAFPHFRARKS
jgi:hypothetical protein